MNKLYGVDSETALIDRGPDMAPPLACLTYCAQDYNPGILHWSEAEDFTAYLFDECHIVGANFAYDACVLMRAFPRLTANIFKCYRENRVRDVLLAQKLIDLGTGCLGGYRNGNGVFVEYAYSLAALYSRHGLGSLDKSEDTYRLRYGELLLTPLDIGKTVPADRFRDVYGEAWLAKARAMASSEQCWPNAAKSYAVDDARATLQVDAAQQQFSEFLENVHMQTRYALSRQLMSITGMITDPETCRIYLEETKAEIARCKEVLEKHGLIRTTGPKSKIGTRDLAAAKARMTAVCKELGIEPKLTPKDGISLDAEATRDTGDPVLKAYSTFTSATTIINKVTLLQEGSKGLPLQTSFDMIKENGRCSSRMPSKKTPLIGVQMQNLPRIGRMRNCFVPPLGWALCSIDLGMDELVKVAQCQIWLGASHKLANALNADMDVHCEVGRGLLDCSYEEILKNKKVKGSKYEKARNQSKEINFGGWGVMSANRLMIQMNRKRAEDDEIVDEAFAERIMRLWETSWDAQLYFDAVAAMFPNGNQWSKATIKQFVSGRIRAHIDFPQACNTLFSGLAGDASQAGDTALTEACYLAGPKDPLWEARPVLSVHDEVLLYIRLDRLHDAAYAATKIFVDTAQAYTPDVKLNAAPAAALYYDKNMDTVLKNGELQLWQA